MHQLTKTGSVTYHSIFIAFAATFHPPLLAAIIPGRSLVVAFAPGPCHLACRQCRLGRNSDRDHRARVVALRAGAAPRIVDPAPLLAFQIPLITSGHRFVRGDFGIERVEVLRAPDAAQRVAAGRDQITPARRVQAGAKFR